MELKGRTTIYANYTEQELLSATPEGQINMVLDILSGSIEIHNQNELEIKYLWDYYRGIQDIRLKEKITRKNINNKTVENWAYALIDWKKAYFLGKEIQYVLLDNSDPKEISLLNDYSKLSSKKSKDLAIYEDILYSGRGFRYVAARKPKNEDEAPFYLYNSDALNTEVVYSSKMGNEQLASIVKTSMRYIDQTVDPKTGEITNYYVPYDEYTVYLRNIQYVFNNKSGSLQLIGNPKPIITNEHLITEYYVNRMRMSLIELGKSLFDDINYLESLDKDDMEQFVNSLLVFINCDAEEEDLINMAEMGAVSIKSSDGEKTASIQTVQQRLKAGDTQVYYTRLVTALHQILGIPIASDNGDVSNGDTGKAKLTGQGFVSAGIRIQNDEAMFVECDIKSLVTILKICRESIDSSIKTLRVSNLEPKCQRDNSENILVKTQALMNLYECFIPRKFANSVIGLFSDANAVTSEQERIFGDEAEIAKQKSNNANKQDSNKNTEKVLEKQNQGN